VNAPVCKRFKRSNFIAGLEASIPLDKAIAPKGDVLLAHTLNDGAIPGSTAIFNYPTTDYLMPLSIFRNVRPPAAGCNTWSCGRPQR
jgi:hypothetical protein